MKKSIITVATVIALCGSLTLTSCIGSFQLTKKLMNWNSSISNKFVNELVFIAFWILPVYEVSALADILVINSIEFWSGQNPIEYGTYKIQGEDGQMYLIDCDGKGYTIRNLTDNSTVRLDFNEEKQEWSTEIDGESVVFLTFIDDTHVKMPTRNGDSVIVETSEAGLFAYRSDIFSGQDLAFNK